MKVIKTTNDMRAWSQEQKLNDKRIAIVPTMGALHEGHFSLIRHAKKISDVTVLTIYVNPTQFEPSEDLDKYPKMLEQDLGHAKKLFVDVVFLPSDETMYPDGYQTYVTVDKVTEHLCGESRPNHFRGVATVVAKLFNAVLPDVAIFGEKDFQQLLVIKTMVRDLDMAVEIIGSPIVREADGLAMSSRNKYLSDEERVAARSLNQSLGVAEKMIDAGETSIKKILFEVTDRIKAESIPKIDYVKLVDPETLEDLTEFCRPALLAIAAKVGPARLIDNRLFE